MPDATPTAIFAADFLLVDDTIASSLINALITVSLFSELFGRPRELPKYFFVSFLGVAVYFAIRMLLTKNEPGHMGEGIFTRISNTAQAYFCGINNIAAGFNLKAHSVSETIKYAVYEVLKGIPYATTIFGLDSTNISTAFNDINGTVGQIEPTISSGLLYFGPVLAPIYQLRGGDRSHFHGYRDTMV